MSHKQLSTVKDNDESVINLDERKEYKTLPYSVTRNILKQEELEQITGYDRRKSGKNLCETIKSLNAKEIVTNFCPVFQWLPNYPVKKYLMSDIVSGFTVAIMHIPQGEYSKLNMQSFFGSFNLQSNKVWPMDFSLVSIPSSVSTWPSFPPSSTSCSVHRDTSRWERSLLCR